MKLALDTYMRSDRNVSASQKGKVLFYSQEPAGVESTTNDLLIALMYIRSQHNISSPLDRWHSPANCLLFLRGTGLLVPTLKPPWGKSSSYRRAFIYFVPTLLLSIFTLFSLPSSVSLTTFILVFPSASVYEKLVHVFHFFYSHADHTEWNLFSSLSWRFCFVGCAGKRINIIIN